MVLHGFLATRQFRTVANLSNALYDEGYTVLAPTLTLNINHRKVSLACEAIHLHNIDGDIAEIRYWVDWLANKAKGKKIVLVGHSFGSLHSLLYSLQQPNPAVAKIIATSLVDAEHTAGNELAVSQINTAQNLISQGSSQLGDYKLSYCKKYVSPAKAFLSYAVWSKQRILEALATTTIPIEIILGNADQRMGNDWISTLKTHNIHLKLISGANHFFDAEHEFDLLENVLQSLSDLQ